MLEAQDRPVTQVNIVSLKCEVQALLDDPACPAQVQVVAEEVLRRAKAGLSQDADHGHILQQYAARRQQQDRWGK